MLYSCVTQENHVFIHQVGHIDNQQCDVDYFNWKPHSQDSAWVNITIPESLHIYICWHNLEDIWLRKMYLYIIVVYCIKHTNTFGLMHVYNTQDSAR